MATATKAETTTKKSATAKSSTKKTADKKTSAKKNNGKKDLAAKKKPSPVTKDKNQILSNLGEDLACHYLEENGIEILDRNWVSNYGEADIVAMEDDVLIFCEVKTRSEGYAGLPEYAITKQRRSKYEKIATSYLAQNILPSGKVRFDVIAVQMMGDRRCLLRHHRDAFSPDE